MRTAVTHAVAIGVAVLVLPAADVAADSLPKPRRIVSLNLCTDELVLRLADLQRIASVTWLSRDPSDSNVAELAAKVPINHGLAEQIVPLKPDLVIADRYTTRTAVALVRRVGIPLTELDVPRTIGEIRTQLRTVAELLGERERGERIVAGMDERLAAQSTTPSERRPRAIVLNPNGVTVGRGTLVDDILARAGLVNLAAQLGIESYGQVPLERVVFHEPDILIVSSSRAGPPALGTDLLRHPVLARLGTRTRQVVMPTRLWTCGGPAVVDAIERLRHAVDEVQNTTTQQ